MKGVSAYGSNPGQNRHAIVQLKKSQLAHGVPEDWSAALKTEEVRTMGWWWNPTEALPHALGQHGGGNHKQVVITVGRSEAHFKRVRDLNSSGKPQSRGTGQKQDLV